MNKKITSIIIVLAAALIIIFCLVFVDISYLNYQSALTKYNNGELDSAANHLYSLAKDSYKDSREIFDSICTPEWLFGGLSFGNIKLTRGESEEMTDNSGQIFFRDSFYAAFTLTNNGPFPIEGSFHVTMIVAGGAGGPVKTVVYTIDGVLQPGESRACQTESFSYDSYGDYGEAEDSVGLGVIADSEAGLKVYFEDRQG